MPSLIALLTDLKRERTLLNDAIAAIEHITHGKTRGSRGPRVISPAARKRIADAQRARWAKWRKQRKAA